MGSIRDWPDQERPREKLRARGAGALSDAELLAVFIGSGRRGRNAVDLGRDLLTATGGLKALLERDAAQVQLGPVAWCRLQAALEIGRRYLDAELRVGEGLTDPSTSARFLKAQLGAYPYEVFACLFLDNRHRVLAFEELFRGSIDGASVHPREVVRHCLRHNAAAVIFAHNHPSGVTEPSSADRAITLRLREALALVDVRVLDHFVVGAGTPTSLAQRGMI
ncbi:MAG TPA: DNA repair protein RadC [Dokdonella sp.]|uniref:RadC family protein n=1 Tax=Dokdonella sp. TaxID=2291710 RepID=UPI0025BFA25C|nr:DNA repair protein RadC [Dokdonella sp.]MBX3691449.1 DNA repair protein RadC [Dokdonella sp.]MCW5568129.1 DNA repair protein RadC [Dokdonella sp.]HNR91478.1 DNA repair protein RadC [Dokdonella sp.]